MFKIAICITATRNIQWSTLAHQIVQQHSSTTRLQQGIPAKEPKATIGKTKVVSGTRIADLIAELALRPRDQPFMGSEFPEPLAVVSILGLRILCQHGQGWQGRRCCLGRDQSDTNPSDWNCRGSQPLPGWSQCQTSPDTIDLWSLIYTSLYIT